ncbi:PREDICTED: uncharacterized protein sll1147-like, partial [Priapulus caudatus]|uniref:Uncharacterized protein sll1147-like n=1 Tax=Priapulus caudatus TaxID=37621 RepID=A0ABM1F3C1_PRICU
LVFTLRCEFLEALVIFITIASVQCVRFNTTARDPTSRGAERITDVPVRILQNTLEQFVVGCVSKLTLATFLTQRSMTLIPLLVALWCVGRVAFAIGYLLSPMRRAIGFVLTSFSTYVAIGGVAYCCYTSGIGHDIGTVAGV